MDTKSASVGKPVCCPSLESGAVGAQYSIDLVPFLSIYFATTTHKLHLGLCQSIIDQKDALYFIENMLIVRVTCNTN